MVEGVGGYGGNKSGCELMFIDGKRIQQIGSPDFMQVNVFTSNHHSGTHQYSRNPGVHSTILRRLGPLRPLAWQDSGIRGSKTT